MLLPNAADAIIAPEKIRDYLLNPEHAKNRGKWRLFEALGYTRSNWPVLEADIREQHLVLDAEEVEPNAYARRYRIEGELKGPIGRARIRTTWAIPHETGVPRLTSAYRVKRRDETT